LHDEPQLLGWPLGKRQQVRDPVDGVGQQQGGGGLNTVGVHLFKIKRPERANQLGNGWKNSRPHERKKITQEEAHVRKVASVLGIPLDQARALARGVTAHGGQQLGDQVSTD
jgi:hypothetical protein